MLKTDYKIGVFGLWHLGCVLCAVWSKLGFRVRGFDYNKERVTNLLRAKPPIFEPNLTNILSKGLQQNSLSFSNDSDSLKDCDFIFLSYDTPVLIDDTSDLSILDKSVKDLINIMKDYSILIISSQSPVGFCSHLRKTIRQKNKTLELAYSPENLRLGESIECYLNPDRIIIGTSNKETEKKCYSLFEKLTEKILTMNIESSEMVKHGINSFLAMSIVFADNFADLCEETGADMADVVRGLKSDPRIGSKSYLSPGIGFSGGTLGRDLKVLDKVNEKISNSTGWFGCIHDYNSRRKNTIINKIDKLSAGLAGKTIGILGLTYKPGTSTLRRSLPLEIVEQLVERKANIKVYDPKADYSELDIKPKFTIKRNIEKLSLNADLIVLLTEWPQFKKFDWTIVKNNMKTPTIFDTKNFLNREELNEIGLNYYSIGR